VQEHQDSFQFRATRHRGGDSSCVTAVRQEAQRIYESINGQPRRLDRAVDEVAASARALNGALITAAEPRDRAVEAERARARTAARFGARRQR
jgi:hypothetical protein